MPRRRLRLQVPDGAALRAGFAKVRAELGVVTDFPPDVLAAADAAAARAVDLDGDRADLRDVPFATLDPPGSKDLDQAYAVEERGAGFRLHYAIADVGSYVEPGGVVDREASERVETLYPPDGAVLLHPAVLAEGAASLLPDVDRFAVVWTLDVDPDGVLADVDVRRAVVRSREQQDYPTVQRELDGANPRQSLGVLRRLGTLLHAAQGRRGGMNLDLPEQVVVPDGDGYALAYRAPLPVEEWNAQLSLLTGMAAARLMVQARVGLLRTMPPADERDVARLRRVARVLGIAWAPDEPYGVVLRRLDPTRGHDAAFVTEAASLFRGAAYVAFDGEVPAAHEHAAIAAPYAHCTAPLRRLADRYVSEVCLGLAAGGGLPDWARTALPGLPSAMARGDQRANRLDSADVSLVEAAVLSGREGEVFDGIVVDLDERRGGGTVQLAEPAVRGRVEPTTGPLPLGDPLRVRLLEADVDRRVVRFAPAWH